MFAVRPLTELENMSGDDLRRIDYVPTPSEIAKACATIRSRWSLSEKRRRYVGDWMPEEEEFAWRPPVVDTSHFRMSTMLQHDAGA